MNLKKHSSFDLNDQTIKQVSGVGVTGVFACSFIPVACLKPTWLTKVLCKLGKNINRINTMKPHIQARK